MDLANVIALIVLVLGVAGSLFAVYLNLSGKIDRSYERMDENKEQYYDNFITKSSHETDLKYIREIGQEKHDGLMELVKEKFENLTKEIRALGDKINKQTGG